MTESVHAFGEREARRIAEVDRRVLGVDTGTSVESFDEPAALGPITVKLTEAPDPGEVSKVSLLDSQLQEVRDIDLECLEHIAFPVGRFGFAMMPPRFLAVLTEDLPPDPGIYPTGSTTVGSTTMTTSIDLTPFVDDYTIVVNGAGENGEVLATTIDAATAGSVTLADPAKTAVTDADVSVLSIAEVWILELTPYGRLVRKMIDGEPVTRAIVNRWRHVPLVANMLTGIEYVDEWRPYTADCAASTWVWPEVLS